MRDKGKFAKNTREMFPTTMQYMASMHEQWEVMPNHERISPLSACYLQATRQDLDEACSKLVIDESVPIVTVLLDLTTDLLSCHFTKLKVGTSLSPTPALLEGMLARSTVDKVPIAQVAQFLTTLGTRAATLGKIVHLFALGCNTCTWLLPLKERVPKQWHSSIWVLCTNHVWPSDLSSCLWHFYGELVTKDLDQFRINTRVLLDQFTEHWKRQHITDESLAEAKTSEIKSLADLVFLDRLDHIVKGVTGFPIVGAL